MATILVADDDHKLLNMLRRTLAYEGFRVVTVADGHEALTQIKAKRPDAIVLDWLMPGLDGVEVTEHLRAADDETPILMLTARDAIENRVEGLDSGADDYLVKPFAFQELLARIRALLRRGSMVKTTRLQVGNLVLDTLTHRATRAGRVIELTAREYALLEFLMRHPHQVLSRTQIADHVWRYDYSSNVVDVYIRYLRRKIDRDFARPLLHTIRGAGYKLSPDAP